jgi:hypothetical protein
MSMPANPHLAFRTHCDQPLAFVPTRPPHATPRDVPAGPYALPPEMQSRLLIHVIHDGDVIPAELLVDRAGAPIPEEAFYEHYVRERDWGAAMVAGALSRHLGLAGFWNVEIARVVMDFGRFPGITTKDDDHLTRHAINYPFSKLLNYEQKRRTLEHYYDAISEGYNEIIPPAQVKLAIHTYDPFNQSGTRRPPVSIITRCVGYQVRSEMPFGVFDPLYPDILGEFTSDRILRDRLSLTLESAGIHTEHNYPYLLPDGSVEVRSQVWSFFRIARQAFEAAYPETKAEAAFGMVWRMLLDTNLRSSQSEMLRSYLHAFRRVPEEYEAQFAAARRAYERIGDFIRRDDNAYVEHFRHMPSRPSALGMELRKDVVFELDGQGRPIAPRVEEVTRIAEVIARGLHVYFTQDCPQHRVTT